MQMLLRYQAAKGHVVSGDQGLQGPMQASPGIRGALSTCS